MHATLVSELLTQFQSDPEKGLTSSQVTKNKELYGPNVLPRKKGFTIWGLIINQFADIIVWILLGAATLSFVLHEYVDGWVILGIIILNAIFGFSQEFKAEKGMEALLSSSIVECKVIRNNQTILIPSAELVPGDVVVLEAGDKIMSDMRLLSDNECYVDESLLTGESVSVQKDSDYTSSEKTIIADQRNMLFSWTSVTKGTAKALVVATGEDTQIGKVVDLIQSKWEWATPLQHKLAKFSKQVATVVLFLSLVMSLIARYQWKPRTETIFIIISLAVSSIPEWLVAVVTITLAVATKQLFKQHALVRKLRSIESLGTTTVICTDKTGTLTQNRMTVTDVRVGRKDFLAVNIDDHSDLNQELWLLYDIITNCNNAALPNVGDPTEIALLEFTKDFGITKKVRLSEIPFDSDKKYMATVHEEWTYIKWSTEQVLALCDKLYRNGEMVELSDNLRQEILEQNSNFAGSAIRVLGCAICRGDSLNRPMENSTFVGMVGMIDPPREEVRQAIADAYTAGMKVVMITGDHLLTAKAIAREIGLEWEAMEGKDFESSENRLFLLKKTCIFARVTPAQKVMICEWLKQLGHHVVMTGDGVNDAAALKAADIGFAMGITGTQVSKDASDIVLLDDNFATIVTTIKQGRIVYDNIKKFIVFMLAVNFDEMMRVLLSFWLWFPVPMTAIQILWINLITDGFPALWLGFDKGDSDIMTGKPRDPKEWLLDGERGRIIIASLLASMIWFWLFLYNLRTEGLEVARTVSVVSAVCFEMFLIFSFRHKKKQAWNLPANSFLNISVFCVLVLQFLIIYSPWAYIFDFVPLSLEDVILCFVTGASGFLVFEAWKWIKNYYTKKANS